MPSKKLALSLSLISIIVIVVSFYYLLGTDKKGLPQESFIVEEVLEEPKKENPVTIGQSVNGRAIEVYTYGTGEKHVLVVGGIHGGYEWNSVLLAYEMIDYFEAPLTTLPENITLSIIPSLNPDGLFSVVQKEGRFTLADVPDESSLPVGTGRFNANDVDLNRNFDCKWQPESTWRGNKVSAGASVFSEPEAQALKRFVESHAISVAAFLHSQANAVYASECHEGVLPETLTIMNTYANASGYRGVAEFGAYPVTGDAEGWLASIGIPAITVELATHKTIEWDKNRKGLLALLNYINQ